ncbi:hypothetical protein [Chryseobacterium foetidum]|uniref:hypothetical protein n=1 Tax=Chryseobacterium foetidum TaxID=2951057 RepID=UPI0021C626A7|nr:hypothetical protein [Chryseobacterium foetidum]
MISCGIETDDKEQIFYLWTNSDLPNDVKTINAKYWESGHWSKEYEIYIHLKPSEKWWTDFKKINNLNSSKANFSAEINSKLKSDFKSILTIPKWFKPTVNSTVYQKENSEYYWNEKTHDLFIHEIQL